jgi:hypothetical protein
MANMAAYLCEIPQHLQANNGKEATTDSLQILIHFPFQIIFLLNSAECSLFIWDSVPNDLRIIEPLIAFGFEVPTAVAMKSIIL